MAGAVRFTDAKGGEVWGLLDAEVGTGSNWNMHACMQASGHACVFEFNLRSLAEAVMGRIM